MKAVMKKERRAVERPVRAQVAQRVDPQTVPANQPAFGALPAYDRPAVVQTYQGLTLLADDPERRGQRDDVLGVGPSGVTLARMTPRAPVGRALDLGCGAGLQALLMARHSVQVVATDVNPRALACTDENARANGVGNISLLLGDLFTPLTGQRFDLIVANPPFVVSPDHYFWYRDGGTEDGGICRRVLSQIHAFLEPGGLACVQCEWPIGRGERWWTRIHDWTHASGCDVWLHGYVIASAERHAQVWLGHGPEIRRPSFDRDVARWLDWYRQHGIEAIGGGVVFLRRRSSGHAWMRAVFTPTKATEDCGDQILRIFEAQTVIQSEVNPGPWFNMRFRLAPEARWLDEPATGNSTRSIGSDLGLRLAIPDPALRLLTSLDGYRSLGELVESLGLERGGNGGATPEDQVRVARHAYGLGLLTRTSGATWPARDSVRP